MRFFVRGVTRRNSFTIVVGAALRPSLATRQSYYVKTIAVRADQWLGLDHLPIAGRQAEMIAKRLAVGANDSNFLDRILIDKMFVDAICTDRNSTTIVETLVDLARNMRMDGCGGGRKFRGSHAFA
jgi:hypothetical protein